MNEKTVLAIDPGTSKCGMAVLTRMADGKMVIQWRAVVPPDKVLVKLHEAYATQPFNLVIVGSGTGHRDVVSAVREHIPGMGLLVVDEKNTSQQARERYWERHPRKGWRKLLPASMQTPPDPVDDYVATILAERVLSNG